MDEFARAALFEEALQEMDEMGPCAEPLCQSTASPNGKPYVAGVDDQDKVVYFRRYSCAAGHHYQQEWTW